MILELRAEVESTTLLPEEFNFSFEHKDVLLIPKRNKDGRDVVAEISIRKRIPDDAGFRTEVRPRTSAREPAHISIVGDERIGKELIRDLQFIESLLSLYGVTRVFWDFAKHSFIPETDAEKRNLQVHSISRTKQYLPIYYNLETDRMNETITKLRELTVPLAFFREGNKSFLSLNYIAAFQNFYFILEGYYAKGSHKNQETIFLSSTELLRQARAAYFPLQQIADKLNPMFKFYKLTPSPESFLRLVVKVRHRLHHYFRGEKQETYFGTPLLQEMYQPISLALMILCTYVLFAKRDSLLAK